MRPRVQSPASPWIILLLCQWMHFQQGSMTIFTHTGWHKNASAGNRTRVNCLEGSYAHHYTTDALQYTKVATKWIFFCSVGLRRKSFKPNFNQWLMDFCSTEQLQSTTLTTELSKLSVLLGLNINFLSNLLMSRLISVSYTHLTLPTSSWV